MHINWFFFLSWFILLNNLVLFYTKGLSLRVVSKNNTNTIVLNFLYIGHFFKTSMTFYYSVNKKINKYKWNLCECQPFSHCAMLHTHTDFYCVLRNPYPLLFISLPTPANPKLCFIEGTIYSVLSKTLSMIHRCKDTMGKCYFCHC